MASECASAWVFFLSHLSKTGVCLLVATHSLRSSPGTILRKALATAMNMMKRTKNQWTVIQCKNLCDNVDNEPAEQIMLIGGSESVVGSRNMQIYYANYNEAAKAVLNEGNRHLHVFLDVGKRGKQNHSTLHWENLATEWQPHSFRQPQSPFSWIVWKLSNTCHPNGQSMQGQHVEEDRFGSSFHHANVQSVGEMGSVS